MADEDWWYDLKTHSVVPDNHATKVTDLLGPIPDAGGSRARAGEGGGAQRGVGQRSALERRLSGALKLTTGGIDRRRVASDRPTSGRFSGNLRRTSGMSRARGIEQHALHSRAVSTAKDWT